MAATEWALTGPGLVALVTSEARERVAEKADDVARRIAWRHSEAVEREVRRRLRRISTSRLVDVTDRLVDRNERTWRKAGKRAGQGALNFTAVDRWSHAVETIAAAEARHELAARAQHFRADFVELLADAFDRGDAGGFARAAALWRRMPEPIRAHTRAWNGADVDGFDPWREDVEVWSFLPSAERERARATDR